MRKNYESDSDTSYVPEIESDSEEIEIIEESNLDKEGVPKNLKRKWAMVTEHDFEDLKTQNIILKKEVNEALGTLQMAEDKVDNLRKNLARCESQLEECAKDNDRLRDQDEALQELTRQLSKSLADDFAYQSSQQDKIEHLEGIIRGLRAEIEQTREVAKKWKKRCKWWSQTIEDL